MDLRRFCSTQRAVILPKAARPSGTSGRVSPVWGMAEGAAAGVGVGVTSGSGEALGSTGAGLGLGSGFGSGLGSGAGLGLGSLGCSGSGT